MSQLDPWTNSSNDPTLREYSFKVKVDYIRRSTQQGIKGGMTEFTQVYLVPDLTQSQAERFLNAWLLDEKDKYSEVIIKVRGIYGIFRCGVARRNSFYHKAEHLVVMSHYLETELNSLKKTELDIIVLPASEDIRDNIPEELDTEVSIDRI